MKPIKLTAYDSQDRPTTDYGRAVGWAYNDKTLPRHGGGCSATWKGIGTGRQIAWKNGEIKAPHDKLKALGK